MPSAQEIYSKTVSYLPAAERLRLAAMILEDLKWPELRPEPVREQRSSVELAALARAQAYVRSLVPEGRDLVSELLAERREEARRESA